MESRAKSIAKSQPPASSQQEPRAAYRAASEPSTDSSARARLPPAALRLQAIGLWLLYSTLVFFLRPQMQLRVAGKSRVLARLGPLSADTSTQPWRMQTLGGVDIWRDSFRSVLLSLVLLF